MNRRQFLEASAATAAATIVPRHVLGGPGRVPPSDKIVTGYIGCGSQGIRLIMEALGKEDLHIAAVADPNRQSDDYPTWGPTELKTKIRAFLDKPDWGAGLNDGVCGRLTGKELVDTHYGRTRGSDYEDCRAYADYREMMSNEDLDAVYVMTPDHLHAYIAVQALRQGLHVICHKPMATVHEEATMVRNLTRDTGLATHMLPNNGGSPYPDLIASGVIGKVREVHDWTDRPFWPQGMHEWPEEEPVPDGFDWDLWLGPAAMRPYSHQLTHAVFRGWYDFGGGPRGDGASRTVEVADVLKLGAPTSVQAFPSRFYTTTDTWHRQVNNISYPRSEMVRWEFPVRGDMPPVSYMYYTGGMRPHTPDLLDHIDDLGAGGLLYIGDEGIVHAGRNGKVYLNNGGTRDIPESLEAQRGLDQWIEACKGGPKTRANFEKVYDQITMINIGAIALRFEGKRLTWDDDRKAFTNEPEANKLLTREYREGWELS